MARAEGTLVDYFGAAVSIWSSFAGTGSMVPSVQDHMPFLSWTVSLIGIAGSPVQDANGKEFYEICAEAGIAAITESLKEYAAAKRNRTLTASETHTADQKHMEKVRSLALF